MPISIKSWSKFQHFKDRKPPWVKLYRDLLDDREWHQLDPKAAKLLVMFWLIASEDDGNLPDVSTLAFRLRASESDVKDAISKLSHWLEQDDISVISERYQVAPVAEVSDHQETERETEEETETEPPRKRVAPPDGVDVDVWKSFLAVRRAKKAPVSELAMAGISREAEKAGWTLEAALSEIVTRGWTAFKAEWVTAKPTFAQQAADVRATTVPAKPGRDPALVRLEQDAAKATPMPAEIRQALAQAVGRMTQ